MSDYIQVELQMFNLDGSETLCQLNYQKRHPWSVILTSPMITKPITVSSTDLFSALQLIRIELEAIGWRVVCNGACRNVRPSGMSVSMNGGFMAYVLEATMDTDTRPKSVNIFDSDYVIDRSQIVTVNEQEKFFQEWMLYRKQ